MGEAETSHSGFFSLLAAHKAEQTTVLSWFSLLSCLGKVFGSSLIISKFTPVPRLCAVISKDRGVIPQICANVNRDYRDGQAVTPLLPSPTPLPSSPRRWAGVTPGCRALGRLGMMPGAAVPGRLCPPPRGVPRSSAALLCPPATRHQQQDREPTAAAAFGGHR